jgi:hypothetical protein
MKYWPLIIFLFASHTLAWIAGKHSASVSVNTNNDPHREISESDYLNLGGGFEKFLGTVLSEDGSGYWVTDLKTGKPVYLDLKRLAFGRRSGILPGSQVRALCSTPTKNGGLRKEVLEITSIARWIFGKSIPGSLWRPPSQEPFKIAVCIKLIPDDDNVPDFNWPQPTK